MTELQRGELKEILGAIREVEASLERRRGRTFGAVMIMWGLIAGAIFAFYQVIHLDKEHYETTVGPSLPWLWVIPCAVGTIVTLFIGARVGRLTHGEGERRVLYRLIFLMAVPAAATVWLIAARDSFDYLPGIWVLFLAVVVQIFPRPKRAMLLWPRHALSFLALAAAIALLVHPFHWGDGVAAFFFGIGQVGIGFLKYLHGE